MNELQICHCGHAPTPSGVGTGYGTDASGFTRCYPCSNAHELVTFLAPETTRYGAYMSGDLVTTWCGGELARIVARTRTVGCTPSGGRYEREYIRARDANGQVWTGVGPGDGMYLRLRRRASGVRQ